jgi:hypothetical protein
MKKSERYHKAMLAVVNSLMLKAEEKIEILETLMEAESVAEYVERQEAEKGE